MTDSYRKRQWAGEPLKDQRRIVPEPPRIPPHKKAREYKLTMRTTTMSVRVDERSFPSRAARDQFRRVVERDRKANLYCAMWHFTGKVDDRKTTVEFEESLDGVVTSALRFGDPDCEHVWVEIPAIDGIWKAQRLCRKCNRAERSALNREGNA